MPDAVHVASGKVREIYALDDERLLLVASDRISTFDVVLPTPIPDKGRVLTGLSAFWFARTRRHRPQPSARGAAGRTGDGLPPARDASDRVCRPRLPRGVRLEGLPRDRGRSAGTCSRRDCASRSACRSRSSPLPRRRRRGTTRTSTRSRRPSSAERTGIARRRRPRSRSTASPRRTRRRAGSSSQTRSSSSASPRTGRSCSATRRLPRTRRGSGPLGLRARPGAAVVRQAVRPRLVRGDGLGQDASRARAPRRGRRRVRAPATSRRSSCSRGSRSTGTSTTRRSCSREGDRARPAEGGHPRPSGRGRAGVASEARLRSRQRPRRAG